MRKTFLVCSLVLALAGMVGIVPALRQTEAKTGETKLLLVLRMNPDPATLVAPDALEQSARTVGRRAVTLAGAEADVWTTADNRIVVELPGFTDADNERAGAALTSATMIEIVDPQGAFLEAGTIVVTDNGGPLDGATPTSETVYTSVLDGADFEEAVAEIDQNGFSVVRVGLTDEAADRFFAYTSEHIGQPLSIVIDKAVISTPVINDAIRDQIIIAGLTEEENEALAVQLGSGSLAVPLAVESTMVLTGLPAEPAATPVANPSTPTAVGSPVVAAECWTAAQVVSTEPLQWSAEPAMTIDPTKQYAATVVTNMGEFTIAFFPEDAPITVNNFICLARAGFYDNTPIHRIAAGFVIQGGDPTGTGAGGPGYEFADEPVTRDYLMGTVAMANAGPNTNGSQFFVTLGDFTGQLPKNYTIFGEITDGWDVIGQIASVPTDMNDFGEPSKPTVPVTIERVTISEG